MHEKSDINSSRRSFIRNISFASIVLLSGKINSLSAAEVFELRQKVKLRFVVASDSHYGQPNTLYREMMEKMISSVNLFNSKNNLNFCVINGDIVHDNKDFMLPAKQQLDELNMPYFVTRGNHDLVTPEFWKEIWNMPLNHDVVINNYAIILGDTSDGKGAYVSPDLLWLEAKLEEHKNKKQVLLFLHIPQAKWTKNAIDTPAFFELIRKYPNLKAVFHGHEHDQDGVKMQENIPFFFDSHIGGNWGTSYKGFRVIELLNNGKLITYMMNPTEKQDELSY
jgi:hypothetical protein